MPALRLAGVPDFTEDPSNPYTIDDIAGWWDTPAVNAILVANGGGHGQLATGAWTYTEKYPVLSGTILLPYGQQHAIRAAILKALPIGQDSPIIYLGGGWQPDQQIFVRPVEATFDRQYNHMAFSIKLAQSDPFKYGLDDTYSRDLGVFTGDTWSRGYTNTSGTNWSRTYANPSGSLWTRGYTFSDTAYGGLPNAAQITSDGDVVSQRVTVDITGPLPQGWYIRNEITGERLYSKVAIPDQVTITYDCYRRTARMNGKSIDARTFGDWLTLAPGTTNYFRLYATPAPGGVGVGVTTAHARLTALPAYL